MQDFLRSLGGRALPTDTQSIVDGLRTNLGLQMVRIMGIAPDTHFAQVLVEADYRMKLIAIGLEPKQAALTTFIEKADAAVARNALIRWYFVPNYQCVRTTDDALGMELVGDGIKLVASGMVDAFFDDRLVLLNQQAGVWNGEKLQVIDRLFEETPAALPVRRNEDAFRLLVDSALSGLFQSAEGDALYHFYFGKPSAHTEQMFMLYPKP